MINWEVFTSETNPMEDMNSRVQDKVISMYHNKPFYFLHKYDSRGRIYSQGYHINIQGTEYDKAILDFAERKVCKNIDNIKIAVAGHAGKDKLLWQERIDWFDSIKNQENIEWDEPILGRKALRAYKETLKGNPTGYMMGLDACASGIQMMSILSGCMWCIEKINIILNIYTEH
jgi:hypothetical protein